MPSITTRITAATDATVKNLPLTNSEIDNNFININNAIILGQDVTGFADRTSSTISFNDSTRSVTLAPVGSSFDVYYRGRAYTISSSKVLQIANTGGSHYIYYDYINDRLVDAGATPSIRTQILVAYVYWDPSSNYAVIFGDERHSTGRDTQWHYNQHTTIGAIWKSGGDSTYTLNNTNQVQFSLTGPVVLLDEDLDHSVTHNATPVNQYEQPISSGGYFPVIYLNGNNYRQVTATNNPWLPTSSRAYYNKISNDSGSLDFVPTNDSYLVYWLVLTNDTRNPVKLILGRSYYSSVADAEQEDFSSYDLSMPEIAPMYKIVLKTNDTYTQNLSRVSIASVREVTGKQNARPTPYHLPTHGELIGLHKDDHLQYVHVSTPRTITAEHTFSNSITFSGNGYIKLPSGTTAERPASPVVGMLRYNTDLGYSEQYTISGWNTIAPPPTISNVSPTYYNGESGTQFTINGSNFDVNVVVKFITNSGLEYTAGTITRVSGSQLRVTTPQDFTVADEPLKIKVINGSGLTFQLDNAIDCGNVPIWSTTSGSLASIYDRNGSYYPIATVAATDADNGTTGHTLTFSVISGSLPAGTSLNSSNGQISGDPTDTEVVVTSNFTIRATDNAGNYTDRAFSITVTPYPDGSTSGRAGTSAQAIKSLTGTNTDGVYYINLPTVGVQQVYCVMNSAMDGGGWMMMMKATRGSTFPYTSGYWTSVNTLNNNISYLNRADQDAKMDVMNYFQMKDIMALWPDLANGGNVSGQGYGTVWIENNCYSGTSRITPISFFNNVNNHNPNGLGARNAKWNGGSQFSSQPGAQFYGFNFTANSNYRVRWGFAWNNEGDWGSNDAGGGIGMNATGWSAGDYIGCCQDVTGFNRSARVELYCR